jgi:hypothetical protein
MFIEVQKMTINEIKKELKCSNEVAEFIGNNQKSILDLIRKSSNSPYFFFTWSIEDIQKMDNENIQEGYDDRKPLTIEELEAVKEYIMHYEASNNGIDLDIIEDAIGNIKCKRIKEIMEEVNHKYKQIGDGKNLLMNTWLIKDNILLWDSSETEDGIYSIDRYDFEKEIISEYLFDGTIEHCIDYIESIK